MGEKLYSYRATFRCN